MPRIRIGTVCAGTRAVVRIVDGGAWTSASRRFAALIKEDRNAHRRRHDPARFLPVHRWSANAYAGAQPGAAARGIDVIAVTRPHPGTPAYEEVQGIPTYRVGIRGGRVIAGLSYLTAGLALLARERRRYQVLHCHQMISPMTLALMRVRCPENGW